MIETSVLSEDPLAAAPLRLGRRAALAPSSTIRELLAVTQQPGMRSLAGGLPDPETFPLEQLKAAADRVLNCRATAELALQYGPTDGIAELRSHLATRHSYQGLDAVEADEIVITTGSQQALDLLARVLLDTGDEIAVDDPCYLGARQTFVAAGAQLRAIPVDEDGMQVEVLARELARGFRPRFVYTVANFQNPTGAVLSSARRGALVALAARYGFLVVDDDPYRALYFGADPPESLGNLDSEYVITLGSLSKVLSPGMRIGWLRAPGWLREAVVRAKQACDLHTASLSQVIALEVPRDTEWMHDRLARNRAMYAGRAGTLYTALSTAGVMCNAARGGMFVWIVLPRVNTDVLLERAVAQNVAFVPGHAFGVAQSWSHCARLSFAALPDAELIAAAETLVSLL